MDIIRDALTDHGRKPNSIAPVQPGATAGQPKPLTKAAKPKGKGR
jgi:hypothetical protein